MSELEKEVVKDIVKNPLLDKINKMPGATFRIPSRGLLYTNGELDGDVKDGEVLVKPMTAIDEIYMRTPDMLFQGTAIDVVFKRAIPEIKQPLELYANDVDYLLTCLRKVSYGNTIPISHKCTFCGEYPDPKNPEQVRERIHEYLVPIDHFLQSSKEITAEAIEKMHIELSNGFHVLLRPARMREMLELYQRNDDTNKSPEQVRDMLLKSLLMTIKSVDDITDTSFIFEWLDKLPRNVLEEFAKSIEGVNNWGATFNYKFECIDCHEEQTIDTVLNPLYFFILPSSPTTAKE